MPETPKTKRMNDTQFVLYYFKRQRWIISYSALFLMTDVREKPKRDSYKQAAFIIFPLKRMSLNDYRLVKRICLQWTHCRSKWRQSLHCWRERWMTRGTLSCCLGERWWLFVTKIVWRQNCLSSKMSVVKTVCRQSCLLPNVFVARVFCRQNCFSSKLFVARVFCRQFWDLITSHKYQ